VRENFGSNLNDVTIGIRREEKNQVTPGPGNYSPERAEALTMITAAAFDFSKYTERLD